MDVPRVKRWTGILPTHCSQCHQPLNGAFVDGRTFMGFWALMCVDCAERIGTGLGVGRGQQYALPDGKKVDG